MGEATDGGAELVSEPARIDVLVHEVRSPVAALAAIAAAVEEDDGPVRVELVRLALDACTAIQRIVADMVAWSVQPVPVDVGALVRDVVASRALVGLLLESDVERDLPIVEGDPVRLRQALENLVENAIVHGGGARIVVGARSAGNGVELSVTDFGPGIAPESLDRIFRAGTRLDPTRPGAGLGLAIVERIATAHGGEASAESRAGEGATFTLALPAAPQPAT